MRRFHWLDVWIMWLSTITAANLSAAPFLTGHSDYFNTRINWQVFADFVPDNPQPKPGEYTYLYWLEAPQTATHVYSFNLFGPEPPIQFGEVTSSGYLPGTGIAPDAYDLTYWRWNGLSGINLAPGERTASLYLHSPDEPGRHSAVPFSCNPIVCDPVSGVAVGPIWASWLDRADYNLDGALSLDDYEVWKSAFGTTNSPADGNRDGIVDAADYTVWREAYSNYDWGGFFGSSVPEPDLSMLLFSAFLNGGLIRRRR